MPATIKEDTLEGQRLTITATGPQRIREFKFAGLTHGPANDPLTEAYRMLQDRQIDYGKPHPVYTGISVTLMDGVHINGTPTQARFVVTYGIPQTGDLGGQVAVTIASSTSRQLVRYDKNGNLIYVTYTPQGGNASFPSVGEVPKLVSHLVLEFEYEKGDPPPRDLTGAKNSAVWQDGQPGQWVCRECVSRRIIGRTLWRTKLGFEFDPFYWDKPAIYRDPLTGQIPPDVDPITFVAGTNEGNGWKRAEVFDEYNFNSLNLPAVYPEQAPFNGTGF